MRVHSLKKSRTFASPRAASRACCSAGAKTALMDPSMSWRTMRSSTSTPTRPLAGQRDQPVLTAVAEVETDLDRHSVNERAGLAEARGGEGKRIVAAAQAFAEQRAQRRPAEHVLPARPFRHETPGTCRLGVVEVLERRRLARCAGAKVYVEHFGTARFAIRLPPALIGSGVVRLTMCPAHQCDSGAISRRSRQATLIL